jgi:hypothetical protein
MKKMVLHLDVLSEDVYLRAYFLDFRLMALHWMDGM